MKRPDWLRWPWVARSWCDFQTERANRLMGERDAALRKAATAVFNREQVLSQLAVAEADNRRLAGRNLELGRRLSKLAESDPEHAAALERRIKHLEQQLDDALGLTDPAVEAGALWQSRRDDKRCAKEATS